MIVGVPREIKKEEYRVGIVPGGVRMLVGSGHRVIVERGAGEGAGIMDQEFAAAGATMVGVGAVAQGAGFTVDAVLHGRDPDLAAREGVFTLANAGRSHRRSIGTENQRIEDIAWQCIPKECGRCRPILE